MNKVEALQSKLTELQVQAGQASAAATHREPLASRADLAMMLT